MEHQIRTKFTKIKLSSLKRKEIQEIFDKKYHYIRKCSIKLFEDSLILNIKVYHFEANSLTLKYGIIISKKVGKAVIRNYLKRKIREIIIKILKTQNKIPSSGYFIFIFIIKKL
ncbi:MAG: ribonuclease P protein component [Candidatus Calescibacterium sp.]|nr:ribonuclease P protein component [Candidatus Calescibacterium sp.]MDW8133022.1 ribonuclease P protein component [Candidatus Calescibacterium sp.]